MHTEISLKKMTKENLKLILQNEFNIHKGLTGKSKPQLIELILNKQQPQPQPQPQQPQPQPQQPQPQPQQPQPQQPQPQPQQLQPQLQQQLQPQLQQQQPEPQPEEDEFERLKTIISQLYTELQNYPIQTRNILLYPYFQWRELSIPDVDELRDDVPSDELNEELKEAGEPRIRTISSNQRPIPIIDLNDISHVLNKIEKKTDETYKQIPYIRRNIQKCLGLV